MGNLLKYKGYTGTMEVSNEDECIIGQVLNINDGIGYHGNTYPEIKKAFEEAIDFYIRCCEQEGRKPCKPFSGSFNVRIKPETHKRLVTEAQDLGISFNQHISTLLERGGAKSEQSIAINIDNFNVELSQAKNAFNDQNVITVGEENGINQRTKH